MRPETVRIVSSVPCQLNSIEDKLAWLRFVCKKHKPQILVTPQEFFGGVVMMPKQKQLAFDELFPKLKRICKQYNTALVVGLVELDDDRCNKEVIWFIDERGVYLGRVVKMALPRYDHICTNGSGDIVPETDFDNRFRTFTLQGLHTSAIFCWEVYSNLLWTGLALCKPDVVFSMIKFGVNSWPQVKKVRGLSTVTGFGYGTWSEDGKWIERLRVANLWQVKCPIICSTNSWNLRPISMPLCGCISGLDGQAEETLWHPAKEDKLKEIPEKIVVDEINPNAVRATLKNKYVYKDLVGEFPPYSLDKFTMMLKINRVEDRLLSKKEEQAVVRSKNKKGKGTGGFDL